MSRLVTTCGRNEISEKHLGKSKEKLYNEEI